MSDDSEKVIDDFFAHWRGLPREGEALVPSLSDFFDNLKPAFQPYVVMVNVESGDNWSIRLFGTGRLNSFGQDVKKINPLEIYTPDLRPIIVDKVRIVLDRPCGYRATHRLRTSKGSDLIQTGVTLPLKTDESGSQCVVNFVISSDPIAHDDRKGLIEEILDWEWVDIGAGLPAPM